LRQAFWPAQSKQFQGARVFLLACSGQNGPDATLPSKAFTALIFSESPISLLKTPVLVQFLVFVPCALVY
jgi:hypothetical protein